MPNIAAITRDRYGTKRWKRYTNYKFAAGDAVAPLVLNELPRAALALPLAFTAQGDEFIPSAVQGLVAGQNVMVGPGGHWNGPYIPARYRSYPFLLASAGDREVLCIDEDSGYVTDGEGELFFDDSGTPAKAVAEILSFLNQVSASRKATLKVCAVLREHGLIQPWPISYMTPAGEQRVEGLSRIDEMALNALPDDAFLEVRKAGGLAVAYCQLMSMQHLPLLVQLTAARVEAGARKLPVNQAGELDLEFLNDGPLLDFSRLK
jgi:hypothetical protein